jgi:hypothetical protein
MTEDIEVIAPQNEDDADRRKFQAACGKFAAITPPTTTLLLSTSLHTTAVARSIGWRHSY